MKFIGITGGVGAGKSKVLKLISEISDARILEADEISRKLVQPGEPTLEKIRQEFADEDIWLEDGSFDRAKVASIVFSDEDKRKRFDAIIHPAVKAKILTESEFERVMGARDYLILEAALLIEDGYDRICDELWYIYAPEDMRRARLKESRGYSDEKIDAIMGTQLSESVFREKCVVTIDNSGSVEDLEAQLRKYLIPKDEY